MNRMRMFIALVTFFLMIGSLRAEWQVIPYQWVEISGVGTNTGITGDDENSGPFPLGFDYVYYGNTYDAVRVCSNGFLSFTSTSTEFTNTSIPDPAQPNDAIYPFWDDLYPPDGGTIWYYQDAANSRFIVEFDNIPHLATGLLLKFEVIIHFWGAVEFQYRAINAPNNSCTVGVENSLGTQADQVCFNGVGSFLPAANTAIAFWYGDPQVGSVSGSVSLDGGTGAVQDVTVSCNGMYPHSTNPNSQGDYSLDSVQVGFRTITGVLSGYYPGMATGVEVLEGQTTQNVDLVLRRLEPDAPTNLSGSYNPVNQTIDLNWDDHPDPTVDGYYIFREDMLDAFTLVGTSTASQWSEVVTDNIYHYYVTAVDSNVTPPVSQSAPSNEVTVLAGIIPPTNLWADGYYDDRIHLGWYAPGQIGAELTVSHYEGPMTNAHAHYNGGDAWAITIDPNAPASYQLLAISIYILSETDPYWPWPNSIHEPIIVKAWEDNGGQPGSEIYSQQDQLQAGQGSWLVHEVSGVTASGVIYIGNEQIDASPNCEGMGVDAQLDFPTLNWYRIGGVWQQGVDLTGDLMFEALLFGDFGSGLEARWVSPTNIIATQEVKSASAQVKGANPAIATLHDGGALPAFWEMFHPLKAPVYTDIKRPIPAPDETDDLLYYRIYRNDALYDSMFTQVESYDDIWVVEGVQYEYKVSAQYDNGQESAQTDSVVQAANMPPGPPTSLQAVSNQTTAMILTWADPVLNADGSPCLDLTAVKVYRNGQFLAQVDPGDQMYADAPPDPNTRYTWSVTAIDEVPNEGAAAQVSGAVICPWQVIDYLWVEISGVGQNTQITGDDENGGPFSFGFNFDFYGGTFNSIRVCSNGWLSFTSTSNAYSNESIPTATEPNNLVALFWDDLDLTSGGTIWYYQDVANERFILEFDHVAYYSGVGEVTAEVIFNADGSMIYAYNSITGSNASCTVGIENSTGAEGAEVCYNNTGDFIPASQTAIGWWYSPWTGSLEGVVTDAESGLPLQNAWVEANYDTAWTDVNGYYLLETIPVGAYEATAGRQGYIPATFPVVIDTNQTSTQDFDLLHSEIAVDPTSLELDLAPGDTATASINIANGGNGPLTFSIGTVETWLWADPSEGEVPVSQNEDVLVHFDIPGDAQPGTDLLTDLVIENNSLTGQEQVSVVVHVIPTAVKDGAVLPRVFALHQNYPNPFNPETTIRFEIPKATWTTLKIYNLNGQEVVTLVDERLGPGVYHASFRGDNLASGLYFLKMDSEGFSSLKKMILVK